MRQVSQLLMFGLFASVCAARSEAQGTQASLGVAAAVQQQEIDSAAKAIESAMKAIRSRLQSYAQIARATSTLAAAEHALAAGELATRERSDLRRFRERVAAFIAADHEARAIEAMDLANARDEAERAQNRAQSNAIQERLNMLLQPGASGGVPIPAVSSLVPDVVFTISYGGAFEKRFAGGLGVNTNLLGSVAGSAFDALGSQDLANYFKQNIAISAVIPTARDSKLSSALGLGLGSVAPNHRIGFWPVLGIEELDSADARLSPDLIQKNPSAATWSQITFGVGVPLGTFDRLAERVKCGKLVPILSLGARLPFYYPGNSFSAIGAVFTSSRNQYVRRGGSSFLVAIDIPLLKVGASMDETEKAKCSGL